MRTFAAPFVVALLLAAGTRSAAAQHCHVPEAEVGGRWWWLRAAVSAVAGATDLLGEARDYQGVALGVQAGTGRYSGRILLPAYRLSTEGIGVGDAAVAMAIDVLPRRMAPRAGFTVMVSAPTGNADRGLGMGHVMVSGGAWIRGVHRQVVYGAGAMWAKALGDNSEHLAHRHGGSAGWPLVDPMNPSEIMIDASAIAALVPGRVRAGATMTFATPIVLEGERRLIAAVNAEILRGPYTVGVQIGVPLIGEPFVARGVIEVAYRY